MTPTRVAFLDVDTQVDFIEPRGALYAAGAEAIRSNLGRLVRHAAEQGLPLVSCVDAHAPDDPEFAAWPAHAVKGTPGQAKIPETLRGDERVLPNAVPAALPDPRRVHLVVEKQTTDLFQSRAAEPVLAATGAERVVVFGVVTEVCVKQAALGLLARGYQVDLVEDAVWPLTPEGGEAALRELEAKGARRVTTAEVLAGAPAGSQA